MAGLLYAGKKLSDSGKLKYLSPFFAVGDKVFGKKKKKQDVAGAAGGVGTPSVGSDYSTRVISPTMMNAGGGVSKVGKGDGICRKGKTKGRIV